MVSGLFRKERLLAVIKDFVYFPDSSDKDLKIVCRYPQYFAAVKLFENIKAHLRPEGTARAAHTSARQAAEKAILCSSSQECL